MNQQSHSEATLSRLLAVDWRTDFMTTLMHGRSRGALMQEYLRRAAWWAEELNAAGQWPFFDIAGALAPGVQPPRELSDQLEQKLRTRIDSPALATACRAALRWAALLDSDFPVPPRLQDPFEPLLLMFERGGGFTTEGIFIDLGASSIVRKSLAEHLAADQMLALDPASLNALDETRRPEDSPSSQEPG